MGKFRYTMFCPACDERVELLTFFPIEPRTALFECPLCKVMFSVEEIDQRNGKMSMISYSKEEAEEIIKNQI